MEARAIQHLYSRAGFGISNLYLKHNTDKSKLELVDYLFKKSEKNEPLQVDISEFLAAINNPKTGKQLIKTLRKKSITKIRAYNYKWIERLATTDSILREKMTLFWANHFVCRDLNIVYAQKYNNTLRKYALGNFRDFVKAISKEASMIKYLNTKQNRKLKPNENFARELMELFTLGADNYSEKDIKESARAFTGYNFRLNGDFVLRQFHHDEGEKTFFGKTGNFNGDDIIDIILEQKQCARFICQKIYRYFVNDIVDKNHLEELTNIFYNDYDIEKLMRHILLSNWFYNKNNIGTKIKSPIEFLVGIYQLVPFNFENRDDIIKIQKLLGQLLLYPPNVAGWKGGRYWIDSNTMMLRLKLPSVLLANANISIKEKGEFEDSFEKLNFKKSKFRVIPTKVDWETFDKKVDDSSFDDLMNLILLPDLNPGTAYYLKGLSKTSKREYCIQLMSLPEYQMC